MTNKKGDITYEIRADDSRVESDIEQANKKVEKAARKSAEDVVKVEQSKTKKITAENDKVVKDSEKTADDVSEAWKAAGKDAEKAMADIEVNDVTVDVDANTGKAESSIRAISKDKSIDVDVDADVSDADDAIKGLGDTAKETSEEAASAFENLGGVISSSLGDAIGSLPLAGQIGELTKGLSGTQAVAIGAGVAASGALIGIGGAAVSAATDIDSAMNQLQASTGITAEQTERYRGVLEDIYKNGYGDSFGDISDTLSQIRQQIGPVVDSWDPSALQNFTESAIALRDTFGYDVTESIRAANTMMDQFGIDGEQAMNLIASGVQNGLDYSGELLDSINEYSVQFQKMGLDAEDMFAIFQKGAESGAFNLDKVGDAVKEMSIRVVDGSDTTRQGFELLGLDADEMAAKFAAGGDSAKEAFNQTIDALAGLEDPLAQNTAGVDLFGTMWEDLGPEAVTALSDIEDSAYETSDAMDGIKEVKYDDLSSQFEALKRNVEMLLVPLGEQLIPILSEIMEDVLPPLLDVLEPLLELVGALLEPLLEIISSVLDPLLNILTELLEPFLELIESCITPLLELVQALLDPILSLIESCIRPLLDIVLELIEPLLQLVSECLQPLVDIFSELLEPIVNLIESALTPLLELLQPIAEFISSVLTPILEVLLSVFQAVFEGFADQIFPVYHKDGLGFLVEVVNPVQQTFFVRVTADTGELMDFGVNFDGFTEQPHFFGTFYNVAPQCADSLIAYEQDGTFRTPEVMFQMMADTSRFAHAGSGNDDFRCPVKVDGGGVLRGDGKVQTGELKGVDALFHQFHGGSVETVQTVFHEYPCGFNGKGTVDVNGEVIMSRYQISFLDFPDEVEHFLCTPYGEGGNHQIATGIQRCLNFFRQRLHIVRRGGVEAVTISAFHDNVVRFRCVTGVVDDGLVDVADVTGKYQLFGDISLCQPDFHTGGA